MILEAFLYRLEIVKLNWTKSISGLETKENRSKNFVFYYLNFQKFIPILAQNKKMFIKLK